MDPRVTGLLMHAEDLWDAGRQRLGLVKEPDHFRIVPFLGHGSGTQVVVRARVLDNREPAAAMEGESPWTAVRRMVARFLTNELPGVPIRVRVGDTETETRTDREGYVDLRVEVGPDALEHPWTPVELELSAPYRGLTEPHTTHGRLRVPDGTGVGVISDVDDTILHTGAQRLATMIRDTLLGSHLTRTALPGAAQLYRALARDGDDPMAVPFFYVSSSPWNLHDFLVGFLRHRDFPLGPLLLRDLFGRDPNHSHHEHKHQRIAEVLELHPDRRFLLIGDSGQHDPEIYAEVVRRHPGRILAIYIREVRLDPADGKVEAITSEWEEPVPFLLAHDSVAIAQHAVELGLLTEDDVAAVAAAVLRGGLTRPEDARGTTALPAPLRAQRLRVRLTIAATSPPHRMSIATSIMMIALRSIRTSPSRTAPDRHRRRAPARSAVATRPGWPAPRTR